MSQLAENTREKLTLVMLPVEEVLRRPEVSEDPLHDLMTEFSAFEAVRAEEEFDSWRAPSRIGLDQREDFAWVTLEKQLAGLADVFQRIHYYLTDVDDSLRR